MYVTKMNGLAFLTF